MFIPLFHQSHARERQLAAKEEARRANEHACTSIRCVGCASAADDVRRALDHSFADLGVLQTKSGNCAFFRIGPERGAVHSEPRMSDDGGGQEKGRIFINVVPGKREELERLMGKWGMGFPRSWWIAPSRVLPGTS
ncbi:threonine aldolase [Apiospora phragmitis]|uniref:Threonine aldolase n=1 Tax=Apiospora phragmitis TaxID=2905665 RepID=A0ABR1VSJ8_9PEZI